MLEKLVIKHFQCHSFFTLEFDPHLTVICGPSDRGKSAILRALRYICTNQPRGNAFIRSGEKSTELKLVVDGRKITREKGEINSYSLDRKEFHAFGSSVPEEIEKLLNLSEINFQTQLEAPFWFLKTPGEVSKELNSIVDLQLIDKVLTHLASKVRHTKSVVSVSQERLQKAREEKKSLEWVVEADKELARLSTVQKDIALKRTKLALLGTVLSQATTLASNLQSAQERILEASRTVQAGEMVTAQANRVQSLDRLLEEEGEVWQRLQNTQKAIKEKQEELEKLVGEKCPLCGRSQG